MNPLYSITQWLLTLFFGPVLAGLYNVFCGAGFWGPYGGIAIYLLIVLISVLISMPALLLHLFFNWLFFKYRFHKLFIKAGMILLTVMLILVSLVVVFDFDLDNSLVIGYGLAAIFSGAFLPIVENDKKTEIV